jgi:uncharacterized protein (DUF4213/DUF364 family)
VETILTKTARRVLNLVDDSWGLRLKDYCVCLNAAYAVVEDKEGRESVGFTHIPREDLHYHAMVKKVGLENIEELVGSINPISRSLGVSILNAVSQYLISREYALRPTLHIKLTDYIESEPVCFIGNMGPLVRSVKREGYTTYIFEKNPMLRHSSRECMSDAEEYILLPQCKTLIITGMTLLNNTLEMVLALSREGYNMLVGPTAGIYPPALWGHGINIISSLHITRPIALLNHLRLGGFVTGENSSMFGVNYIYDFDKGEFVWVKEEG